MKKKTLEILKQIDQNEEIATLKKMNKVKGFVAYISTLLLFVVASAFFEMKNKQNSQEIEDFNNLKSAFPELTNNQLNILDSIVRHNSKTYLFLETDPDKLLKETLKQDSILNVKTKITEE